MGKRHRRDLWLQDIAARQRNIVFPDTIENETRFWGNLGKQSWSRSTRVGLFVLGVFVFGMLGALLTAIFQEGITWTFVLVTLFFWGAFFSLIAWSTRRTLRNVESARDSSKTRKH